MYAPYASAEDYRALVSGAIPEEQLGARLREASHHVDSVTYNRIVSTGFENLTEFQQEIVKEVVCRQAEFEYTNEDLIQSVLSSYSVNDVSMQFGPSWNVHVQNGVAMQKSLYALLVQTGLTCGLLR